MHRNDEVRRHLATHDGVITMAEANAWGLSRHSVTRLLRSGAWVREARGVYRADDHPRTPRTRMRIAVASSGRSAVLAGSSAAWWHQLTPGFPAQITVIARTRGRHPNAQPGVGVLHRRLTEIDVEIVDGLPVTALGLTILDTAAEAGAQIMDNALLCRRITIDQLVDSWRRYPGRHGAGTTRRLLDALGSGARSEAERITVRLFRAGSITGWLANHVVDGHAFDFVFPESKLIVEIDGFAFHRDAAAFQRDRTLRNALLGRGWSVLTFTWDDITRRPDEVLAAVRSLLREVAC